MREGGKSYGQFCGLARALDLVGERWALLVVRELLLGPRRFTDLLAGLPGVSTNVLSERLRRLERRGIVERSVLPPPAASAVYGLTPYGRDLEPVIAALGRWGARSLGPRQPDEALRSHWLALALKAFFHAGEAPRGGRAYEVRLRDEAFGLHVEDGSLRVERGGPAGGEPSLVLAADDDALVGLLAGVLDRQEALSSGAVELVSGDEAELEGFLRLFRFEEPAPAAK
ncbi:MAG TPA: winged helix-turn-helix transcriptional regulator [Gaiellaceae bacterium]|nr:winged helix-turn-helix transcriptional regulator [Gaiellaceae bacterium]